MPITPPLCAPHLPLRSWQLPPCCPPQASGVCWLSAAWTLLSSPSGMEVSAELLVWFLRGLGPAMGLGLAMGLGPAMGPSLADSLTPLFQA